MLKLDQKVQSKKDYITSLENNIKKFNEDIDSYKEELLPFECGLYTPRYGFATSTSYKARLDELRAEQKQAIKTNQAITYTTYEAKKNISLKPQVKIMLRTFNSECENFINTAKSNNFYNIENKIKKSFTDINTINKNLHISISYDYLDLKIKELQLSYEYELKKEDEREILRQEREKEKEERAAQKQIEAEKKKVQKEIDHIDNVITELQAKLEQSVTEEKTNIQIALDELLSNKEDFIKQKEDLDYRAENLGAGYVYIISNIGAFGENVFKIGVTRRLDPLERIAELSSASVPFKFDVHAIIFSYKAYELESNLHKVFEKNRVNLINSRKEFFNISIEDIENELSNYKDLTIEFIKEPEAKEYKETLKLRNAISE